MSQKREHVLAFRRALERNKARNLSDSLCRALAVQEARRLVPLPPDEQTEVNRFLAERHPPPRPEPRAEGFPSIFDYLPRVK
jgi:hypothetical protein